MQGSICQVIISIAVSGMSYYLRTLVSHDHLASIDISPLGLAPFHPDCRETLVSFLLRTCILH